MGELLRILLLGTWVNKGKESKRWGTQERPPNLVVAGFLLEGKGKKEIAERRCVRMRKKMTMFLAAVMTLLITASPAMADPPAAAHHGLHTAHDAIPAEAATAHENVPYPPS
jgi:hypothetical protein